MTTPLSDAVAAMAQVIDAQARHIAKLEAGHWSQETRAEVTAARTILDQITDPEARPASPYQDFAPPAQCEARLWDDRCALVSGHREDHYYPDFEHTGNITGTHPQDLDWAEKAWAKREDAKHHNHPDDGTKEPGCPRCQADAGGLIALLALHGDKAGAERLLNNLITTGDISDPPEPQQAMIEDCNAARQVAPSMRAPLPGEPSMFDKGGPLPCAGRRTDDGAPCTLNAPHVWPHMWPASVQDDETDGDRCPATNLGAGWGRCTRTTGHIGAHQYAEAETE